MATGRVLRSQMAALLGVEAGPGADVEVSRVSGLEDADEHALVFAQDSKSLEAAIRGRAGVILARDGDDPRVLRVEAPRLAFSQIYSAWFDERGLGGISPTAYVAPGAEVGEGCQIGAGVVIEAGAKLGECCVIGPRAVIHGGTTLGKRGAGAGGGRAWLGWLWIRSGEGRVCRVSTGRDALDWR